MNRLLIFILILFMINTPSFGSSINPVAYRQMQLQQHQARQNYNNNNRQMPYWQVQSNYNTRNRYYNNYSDYIRTQTYRQNTWRTNDKY